MTDTTDIAALRPSERAKLGFVTDDNTGGYYVAECDDCGEIFPSQNSDGGGQIADTGDYDDFYCPHCGNVDPEECDNANLVWNVQQSKIIKLNSQLEAERQRADDAERKNALVAGGIAAALKLRFTICALIRVLPPPVGTTAHTACCPVNQALYTPSITRC